MTKVDSLPEFSLSVEQPKQSLYRLLELEEYLHTPQALRLYLSQADEARQKIGEPDNFLAWYEWALGAVVDAALAGEMDLANSRMNDFLSSLADKSKSLSVVLYTPSAADSQKQHVTVHQWVRRIRELYELPIFQNYQNQMNNIWTQPCHADKNQEGNLPALLVRLHKTVITGIQNSDLDDNFIAAWAEWVHEVYQRKNYQAIEYLLDINRLAGIAGTSCLSELINTTVNSLLTAINDPNAVEHVLRLARWMTVDKKDEVVAYSMNAFQSQSASDVVKHEAVVTIASTGNINAALKLAEEIKDEDKNLNVMLAMLSQAVFNGDWEARQMITQALKTKLGDKYNASLAGMIELCLTSPVFPRDRRVDLSLVITAIYEGLIPIWHNPYAVFRLAWAYWISPEQTSSSSARIMLDNHFQKPNQPEASDSAWEELYHARAMLCRYTKCPKPSGNHMPPLDW